MLLKFMLFSVAIPLIGSLPSFGMLTLGWFALGCLRFFMGMHWIVSFGYLIPSYFGAVYFSRMQQGSHGSNTISRIMLTLLNVVCMIIFMVDPIGSHAWPYALYWLIPAYIALTSTRSVFASALGATLTTHALGSVQWLLTGTIAAEQWISLIPVVAYERLLCMLVIVVTYGLLYGGVKLCIPSMRKYIAE